MSFDRGEVYCDDVIMEVPIFSSLHYLGTAMEVRILLTAWGRVAMGNVILPHLFSFISQIHIQFVLQVCDRKILYMQFFKM